MYAAFTEHTRPRRRVVIAALVGWGALALAACGTTSPPPAQGPSSVAPVPFSTPSTVSWPFPAPTQQASATAPTTLPAGITVDRRNADAVALSAARIWFGWDTTVDRSPYEAAVRTAPLLTATCAQKLTASPPTGSPGQDWTSLALIHARAVIGPADVAIGSEEHPADTATSAVRIVTVRQPFTADRPVAARRYVVTVTMSRPDQGDRWSVGDSAATQCGVVRR